MIIVVHGLSKELIDSAAKIGAKVTEDSARFENHKMSVRECYVKIRRFDNNATGALVIARNEFTNIEIV